MADVPFVPAIGTGFNRDAMPNAPAEVIASAGYLTTAARVIHVNIGSTSPISVVNVSDGYEGQVRYFKLIGAGPVHLTPDNFAQGSYVDLSTANDSCCLVFIEGDWCFMGGTASVV